MIMLSLKKLMDGILMSEKIDIIKIFIIKTTKNGIIDKRSQHS